MATLYTSCKWYIINTSRIIQAYVGWTWLKSTSYEYSKWDAPANWLPILERLFFTLGHEEFFKRRTNGWSYSQVARGLYNIRSEYGSAFGTKKTWETTPSSKYPSLWSLPKLIQMLPAVQKLHFVVVCIESLPWFNNHFSRICQVVGQQIPCLRLQHLVHATFGALASFRILSGGESIARII